MFAECFDTPLFNRKFQILIIKNYSMNNVLSWNMALEENYEPRDYSYHKEDIQEGEYLASLDFKIWSKKIPGITCYFTNQETDQKFQLTVYRDKKDREYKLRNCETEFEICPTEALYKINVGENGKGNIKFIAAELME